MTQPYRGRLAPSPTGLLHIGHARTFWIAQQRAHSRGGTLVLRDEDLDRQRCKSEFASAMMEDLRWFGFEWQEGPDCGGAFGPYAQGKRQEFYLAAWIKLRAAGSIYPCRCSRQDMLRALRAPHAGEDEPIYPGTCRPSHDPGASAITPQPEPGSGRDVNWRFRVVDGEMVSFIDGNLGQQRFEAGKDF
ncbi:MAG TPA: glutamate--tRNA ligase family protein, partial [Candidatus Eisenbacteria bacterium]|nr:glutamate--tRNA ligase family protein [Candidatus Eisenbacteria bacterium]